MEQTPASTIAEAQAASNTVRDRLIDDLRHTIGEAEQWLHDSAGETVGGGSNETRLRFEDTLRTARHDLRQLEDSVITHGRNVADSIDAYVSDNPWKAVALGAAAGAVIGMLISRK